MIREIVAAGHHDLFRDDNRSQEFYPRITVPAPSLLTQQSHPMTGVQGEPSDPLDIDDFNEGMENTNSGCGRVVPPKPLFHNSVQRYMALNPQYKPKAVYVPGTEKYVP
ncbi:hypothetical protein BGW80DRAFT_1265889 [Lactifluus volemus]|nr:hypothetical protein BGW80DRAFT_1265889 [Lactifluus volemus]